MDCAPLNLAHFHERRADRFMRQHRYDDAYKALETSLLYLQDACKIVSIGKSLNILNTLKWDFERKLRQVQMRKQHHERLKNREIIPSPETNSVLLQRQDSQIQSSTPQLIARSIDKAIASFIDTQEQDESCLDKENVQHEPMGEEVVLKVINDLPQQSNAEQAQMWRQRAYSLSTEQNVEEELDEFPALAPLELPIFDFNVFTTSAPSLAYMLHNDEQQQKQS